MSQVTSEYMKYSVQQMVVNSLEEDGAICNSSTKEYNKPKTYEGGAGLRLAFTNINNKINLYHNVLAFLTGERRANIYESIPVIDFVHPENTGFLNHYRTDEYGNIYQGIIDAVPLDSHKTDLELIEDNDRYTINRALMGQTMAEHFYNASGKMISDYCLQVSSMDENENYLYEGIPMNSIVSFGDNGDNYSVNAVRKDSIDFFIVCSSSKSRLYFSPITNPNNNLYWPSNIDGKKAFKDNLLFHNGYTNGSYVLNSNVGTVDNDTFVFRDKTALSKFIESDRSGDYLNLFCGDIVVVIPQSTYTNYPGMILLIRGDSDRRAYGINNSDSISYVLFFDKLYGFDEDAPGSRISYRDIIPDFRNLSSEEYPRVSGIWKNENRFHETIINSLKRYLSLKEVHYSKASGLLNGYFCEPDLWDPSGEDYLIKDGRKISRWIYYGNGRKSEDVNLLKVNSFMDSPLGLTSHDKWNDATAGDLVDFGIYGKASLFYNNLLSNMESTFYNAFKPYKISPLLWKSVNSNPLSLNDLVISGDFKTESASVAMNGGLNTFEYHGKLAESTNAKAGQYIRASEMEKYIENFRNSISGTTLYLNTNASNGNFYMVAPRKTQYHVLKSNTLMESADPSIKEKFFQTFGAGYYLEFTYLMRAVDEEEVRDDFYQPIVTMVSPYELFLRKSGITNPSNTPGKTPDRYKLNWSWNEQRLPEYDELPSKDATNVCEEVWDPHPILFYPEDHDFFPHNLYLMSRTDLGFEECDENDPKNSMVTFFTDKNLMIMFRVKDVRVIKPSSINRLNFTGTTKYQGYSNKTHSYEMTYTKSYTFEYMSHPEETQYVDREFEYDDSGTYQSSGYRVGTTLYKNDLGGAGWNTDYDDQNYMAVIDGVDSNGKFTGKIYHKTTTGGNSVRVSGGDIAGQAFYDSASVGEYYHMESDGKYHEGKGDGSYIQVLQSGSGGKYGVNYYSVTPEEVVWEESSIRGTFGEAESWRVGDTEYLDANGNPCSEGSALQKRVISSVSLETGTATFDIYSRESVKKEITVITDVPDTVDIELKVIDHSHDCYIYTLEPIQVDISKTGVEFRDYKDEIISIKSGYDTVVEIVPATNDSSYFKCLNYILDKSGTMSIRESFNALKRSVIIQSLPYVDADNTSYSYSGPSTIFGRRRRWTPMLLLNTGLNSFKSELSDPSKSFIDKFMDMIGDGGTMGKIFRKTSIDFIKKCLSEWPVAIDNNRKTVLTLGNVSTLIRNMEGLYNSLSDVISNGVTVVSEEGEVSSITARDINPLRKRIYNNMEYTKGTYSFSSSYSGASSYEVDDDTPLSDVLEDIFQSTSPKLMDVSYSPVGVTNNFYGYGRILEVLNRVFKGDDLEFEDFRDLDRCFGVGTYPILRIGPRNSTPWGSQLTSIFEDKVTPLIKKVIREIGNKYLEDTVTDDIIDEYKTTLKKYFKSSAVDDNNIVDPLTGVISDSEISVGSITVSKYPKLLDNIYYGSGDSINPYIKDIVANAIKSIPIVGNTMGASLGAEWVIKNILMKDMGEEVIPEGEEYALYKISPMILELYHSMLDKYIRDVLNWTNSDIDDRMFPEHKEINDAIDRKESLLKSLVVTETTVSDYVGRGDGGNYVLFDDTNGNLSFSLNLPNIEYSTSGEGSGSSVVVSLASSGNIINYTFTAKNNEPQADIDMDTFKGLSKFIIDSLEGTGSGKVPVEYLSENGSLNGRVNSLYYKRYQILNSRMNTMNGPLYKAASYIYNSNVFNDSKRISDQVIEAYSRFADVLPIEEAVPMTYLPTQYASSTTIELAGKYYNDKEMESLRNQINSQCILTCTRCSVKDSCPFYNQEEVIKLYCTPMETIDVYLKDNELELLEETGEKGIKITEMPEGGSFNVNDLARMHKIYSDVDISSAPTENGTVNYNDYNLNIVKNELRSSSMLQYPEYVKDGMSWLLGGRYGTVEVNTVQKALMDKKIDGGDMISYYDRISLYKYLYNALFIKTYGYDNTGVTDPKKRVPYMKEDSYISYKVSDKAYDVEYDLGPAGNKKHYKAQVHLKMPKGVKMFENAGYNDDVYLVSDDTKDPDGRTIDPVIYLGKAGELQYTFDVVDRADSSTRESYDQNDPNIYADDVAQWCMNYIKGHCADDPSGNTSDYSNRDQYWMDKVYKYVDGNWVEFPGRERRVSGYQEPVVDVDDFDEIQAVSGHPVVNTYYNFVRKVSIRIFDPESGEWLIPWVNDDLIENIDDLDTLKEQQRAVLPLMRTNLRFVVVKK